MTLRPLRFAAFLLPLCTAPAIAQDAAPSWIWLKETENDQEVVFRKAFQVDAVPKEARLTATCDNHMVVLVNGERVGVHSAWEAPVSRDVASFLAAGKNTIEVRARNQGGPAGLALRLETGDGQTLVSDGTWQASLAQRARRGRFGQAHVLGSVGQEGLPWTGRMSLERFLSASDVMIAADPSAPQTARPADRVHLPEGFVCELLYEVPGEVQGSWVSITDGPDGTLFVSDQGGKGLFQITPAPIGVEGALTKVEHIPVEVSNAQGLLWAFDSLYAHCNGRGLVRITDADGDGELDTAEDLIKLNHGGEHGSHAVKVTEDGTGLYFIAGNHTLPPAFDGSRAPANWGEDLLLPRLWDARGHARGKLAPGGWIARCEPDGTNVEIVSSGYRNQYDIALDAEGEMFTYDADMEWDLGSPWYRPTRVCHVTSGSEFGWRSGTGKWPVHYEDSLPPALEVGPGSPTGVLFGAGATFPERYQRALFVLDWTFGTIYAVHLEPEGASFTATKEDFAWAKPLAVTDAVVGADGTMYFTVGGRGSQSALHRIRYTGEASTEPVVVAHEEGREARRARRALERFHGRQDPAAVEAAWPYLGSDDRFLRFAARIAIENQPVETWRARALAEDDPRAAATALIALARQGGAEDLGPVLDALLRQPVEAADVPTRLSALRAYALAFIRLGAPSDAQRAALLAALEPRFPATAEAESQELARLLVHLGSEVVVPRTLELMAREDAEPLPAWAELIRRNDSYGGPIAKMLANHPPSRAIGYALLLRDARAGWTPDRRRQYFSFFPKASTHPGGASYSGFLANIRDDAAALLTPAEERSLAALLDRPLITPLPTDITPPKGPGRAWTHDEAVASVGQSLHGRSYDRGENLFHAVSCSKCHRFDGVGGAIGPDLTTVGNKFSVADLLEAILEPSNAISDQYESHVVSDQDGRIASGILVEDGDDLLVYEGDGSGEPVVFYRDEVQHVRPSKVSQMPTGLVDPLSEDEMKDLIAYLLSGGDKRAAVFRPVEASSGGR